LLLEVNNLTVCFDTAMILNNVSLKVADGELVSLVGSNGAGKSTLIRAITGLVQWEKETKKGTRFGDITIEGQILFDGKEIKNMPAYNIVKQGLIHCPERRRPFTEMSVLDNLKAGAYLVNDGNVFNQRLEEIYRLFPVLNKRKNQLAGTLSGGEQQMLAIGRSLMLNPRLFCIDEPSTGLAPKVKEELFARIKEIHASGITILLVEQDVGLAFSIADRCYVLSHGRIVAEGESKELMAEETVRKSYLGL